MALDPLQVLIYALVITGNPAPAECNLKPNNVVICSNGVSAVEDAKTRGMILNNKILVQPAVDGGLMFSNGITAIRASAGWIRFSSGIQARHDTAGYRNAFRVAPDLICSEISETKAICQKRE